MTLVILISQNRLLLPIALRAMMDLSEIATKIRIEIHEVGNSMTEDGLREDPLIEERRNRYLSPSNRAFLILIGKYCFSCTS
jgi:hypothetical protein